MPFILPTSLPFLTPSSTAFQPFSYLSWATFSLVELPRHHPVCPLLSASFAGFEGVCGAAPLVAFGSGFVSLLREIVM